MAHSQYHKSILFSLNVFLARNYLLEEISSRVYGVLSFCIFYVIIQFVYLLSQIRSDKKHFITELGKFYDFIFKIKIYRMYNIYFISLGLLKRPVQLTEDSLGFKLKSLLHFIYFLSFFELFLSNWEKEGNCNRQNRPESLGPSSQIAAFALSGPNVEKLKRDHKSHRNQERHYQPQNKTSSHAHLRHRESLKPISLTPGCTGRAWA